MKLLITGSRGFVGGSIGRFAAGAGHDVLGVSRARQPDADWAGAHFGADASYSNLAGIVREFDPDVVFHTAGSASVARSIQDPVGDFCTTAVCFIQVLEAVRRSGRDPLVIFPSSAAVYGNPVQLPVAESAAISPISPYGFHKAACEILAREYAQCFGLSTLVCRLFSVLGSRQRRLLVWELYSQLAGPGETVEIQGTGTETRDFLHIDDLCDALLRCAPATPHQACTIMNIASGRETSVRELAETLRPLVAPEKEIVCRGIVRPGDPHRWGADIRSLQALAPLWQPRTLSAALKKTVHQWHSEEPASGQIELPTLRIPS